VTFEDIWLLLLVVPPALWMMFTSRSSGSRQFLPKVFGAAIIVLAFCLPGSVRWESRAAAKALADALTGLSAKELKQARFFCSGLIQL
jgi:hypothetical protein